MHPLPPASVPILGVCRRRAVLFTLLVTMVRMDEVSELEWKLPRLCLNICWCAKSSARGPGEGLLGGGACDPLIPPSIISHLRKRKPVRLRSIHRQQPQIRDRTDDWRGFQLTTCAEGCARSPTPGFCSSVGKSRTMTRRRGR